MKNNIQTILNVCFAISITAFIYQNDKQQDSINKLKNDVESNYEIIGLFNQIQDDTNKSFIKVMSANEVNIDENSTNIGIAFQNFDIAKKNEAITDNKIAQNTETIEYIQKYLSESFGSK